MESMTLWLGGSLPSFTAAKPIISSLVWHEINTVKRDALHRAAHRRGSTVETRSRSGRVTYETEKWWEDEITVSLKGQSGDWQIIRCGKDG
jgi:hypothetical protein